LIAWLQSATTPGLAFPVVSGHGLVSDYPDVPIEPLVDKAGIGGSGTDEFAVLAVLCASQLQPATVKLLAPLLINADTRQGAQVFLEGSRLTTRELFVLPKVAVEAETLETRSAEARVQLASSV
jgi:flagellar assembly factor FliW